MTPSLNRCTQSCLFCWRITPEHIGVEWAQTKFPEKEAEEPAGIIEGCLESHRKALSGFGGNPNVSEEMLEQAKHPVHAAISLEGEPTLYPYLRTLPESFFSKGFKSVFIVTNGLNPIAIENLEKEPSQLYISACAPDKETYRKTCNPMVKNGWEKLLESLELLNSLSCPTVLRHTLIPHLNMHNLRGYAELAEISNATYLEPKAAKSVGYARGRFSYKEMAWHNDIRTFAEALSLESGYNILDEQPQSSIVLLSRLQKAKKLYRQTPRRAQ
jgi:tRNA wybutosine-synthesizing protein 1